jgi:hypothetical protein
MATPNQYGAQPTGAPPATVGSFKSGPSVSPNPMQGVNAGTSRNWGPTSEPSSGGMMGNIMRDWMFSPANPGNMYYSRRGQRGGGGRGRRRGGGGGGGSAQDEATVNNTGNWNINFEGPKFGDQTNLGRGDFGGMMPGGQAQQGSAPTQGQPPARNRPQLTPDQKQRNAETARARRALASDIKKQGTPEQQKRIEEQGVAGGKVRQPRQPKATTAPATSQQTTGSTFSNVSANSIQANQVSAGSMNVGAGATGGPQAAGAPFIDLGSVSGGSASSPSSGAKAQGGTIGGVKIN